MQTIYFKPITNADEQLLIYKEKYWKSGFKLHKTVENRNINSRTQTNYISRIIFVQNCNIQENNKICFLSAIFRTPNIICN
jgi:hypothetical protein